MYMNIFGAILLAALTATVLMADESDFPVRLADAEVLQKMQAGGLVIYMRHGPTDTTQPDQVPEVDLEDCSTQRPLTSEGVEIARQAGQAMRAANIPIGKILVSPMCRTRESAEAAFDQPYTVDKGLMYTAHMTSNQKGFALETINRLLSAPVEAGTNRMLVGHAPNIMDAMGYFPTPEGAVLIFRPRGSEGYEYIATITPELWSELVP